MICGLSVVPYTPGTSKQDKPMLWLVD